jgi:tetratricopeptide (TPR) repeat protein
MGDPEYCESQCPICTRARQGNRLARFLQTIELLVTFGGCSHGRARRKKYGVRPNEPLPPRAKAQEPEESPDDLANRLQREGKPADLEKELQRYSVSRLSEKDKESWFHLWGITAFRRQDRAEAFRRFIEGLEACPDSQNLLFSLGQEYEHRREIDKMFKCFDRCSFPNVSSQFMLAAARYAYLWNRPDKGAAYIEPIAEAYFKLRIADDHFVYVRGLPFFRQTWSYLVAFAWMRNDFGPTDTYFERAARELGEYDFQSARRFYECVKSDDYAAEIGASEATLKQWDSRLPSGYLRVQVAALKARQAGDVGDALTTLEEVRLGTNDHSWLADVLTVHRAWAYSRAGDSAGEAAEIERFLAKQPMLFEPDHAVSFAFLSYQETLKPRYQNSQQSEANSGTTQ